MTTVTVKVLHLIKTRDHDLDGPAEVIRMLTDGSFCDAGTVEVKDEFTPNGVSNEDMYESMLCETYQQTQNDMHDNMLERNGVRLNTFQNLVTEFGGDYQAAEEAVERRGYKVLPAVWNGEYAQRSSMVGDIFIIEGHVFRVQPVGFKFIVAESALDGTHRRIGKLALGENRYAPKPEPRNDFDALCFVGD